MDKHLTEYKQHTSDLYAWIKSFIQVGKSQILQCHHENVDVACLSTDEVHKPPGDPQDKPHPLKIILNTGRKYQEPF